MKYDGYLRKSLTFGADALSVIAGSILCIFILYPDASFSDAVMRTQAFLPMLIITMALVSVIMKTYQHRILEDVASNIVLSVGAFALAFAMSVIFLLLIDSGQLELLFLINLLIYSVFFLGSYRLAFLLWRRLDRFSSNQCKTKQSSIAPRTDAEYIGIEGLLGRDIIRYDIQSVSGYIAGKTVFVSGGAGSIGFELCSQILRYNAKRVVIFDLNENKLLETEKELSLKYPNTQFVTCIGSIQDRGRLRELFDLYIPQIVFHAAAYKNVSMMESNPQEALKNNVMGTLYLVEAAIKHRADRFVLLSSDMAMNPVNIIGASNRVAEMLIQRANTWSETLFSAVRFGTIIDSHGSIVQLFKKQILSGGPVFIPDKSMKKYIMTIPEAVQLILETGAVSIGGEIFRLNMGEPINVYELAKSMISNAGLRPDKDIKIEITGVHSADKDISQIYHSDEFVSKTINERIDVMKATEKPPVMFEVAFDKLCQSIDKRDYDSAFKNVSVLVPKFLNLQL